MTVLIDIPSVPLGSSSLFVCYPLPDGTFEAISEPAYCREGFSLLVSDAQVKSATSLEYEYYYGHCWQRSPFWAGLVKNKYPVVTNGIFYYGHSIPNDSLESSWRKKLTTNLSYANARLAEAGLPPISVRLAQSRDGRAEENREVTLFLVKAPGIFATNVWTVSLITMLTRSCLVERGDYTGNPLWGMVVREPTIAKFVNSSRLVDVLVDYMLAVPPKKDARWGRRWKISYGCESLAYAGVYTIRQICDGLWYRSANGYVDFDEVKTLVNDKEEYKDGASKASGALALSLAKYIINRIQFTQ